MSEKNLIFKNEKYLKEYNNERKQGQEFYPYVYVSEHLPKKFQDQRKLLLDEYRKKRNNRQKAVWKAVEGDFVLFVNDKRIDCARLSVRQSAKAKIPSDLESNKSTLSS